MNGRITGSPLCLVVLAAIVVLAPNAPTHAQVPAVDELLARALAPQHKIPYELTADFEGTLTVVVRRSRLTADATGVFREWQRVDERTTRRRVTVEQLHLPLLLRPFARVLRHVVEEKVETLTTDSSDFHAHDFFILDTEAGNRYVIAGVHRAIVSEAIDRYPSPADKSDAATRRLVARWLFTSPLMRTWIVRSGPPYALETTVDEAGLVHTLTAFYDWGRSSTTMTYTMLNGEPVWTHVVSDITAELAQMGAVHGLFPLRFANYRLDYK